MLKSSKVVVQLRDALHCMVTFKVLICHLFMTVYEMMTIATDCQGRQEQSESKCVQHFM